MNKIVVILYGPPGSGKGTQANLLAKKYGLIHFDTGRFLEAIVYDRERRTEKIIKRERVLFDTGKLMTPRFVLREVAQEAKRIRKSGLGIVFSGSPRTMYEADRLMPALKRLYEKKNIFVFVLDMPAKFSIRRNGKRMTCSVCGHTVLVEYHPLSVPKRCPICAAPLYKRVFDKPGLIRVRLEEYKERTTPIIKNLERKKYFIKKVDARPAPYVVLRAIHGYLEKALGN